jgi:tRNA pseudouridine55 synthase
LVGILPVDKPAGMTSHDVIAVVRRVTGEGRVGHAGTLDPMATGLLVVLVGAYTRLAPYLTSASKTYEATIAFGTETATDDAEGAITREAPVPAEVSFDDRAHAILAALIGPSRQTPPAYSAIKVGGKTAYREARAGAALELEPRDIHVFAANLLEIDADTHSWRVAFEVSKGTYVRALARDLGRAVGSAAHLTALRRTAAGALSLTEAHVLDDVVAAGAEGHIDSLFADPIAVLGLPVLEAQAGAGHFGAGMLLPEGSTFPEQTAVAVTREDRLAGIYNVGHGRLEPAVVLPTGAIS